VGYLEQLRPASFRGVPFLVDETSLSTGKRAQVHQYAERDDWFVEELGANADRFPVTAHLIGDDVFEQRDRLIAALKLPGAGTLVLPVDGEFEAHCLDIRVRDSITGDNRISRLGLTFVRSGQNQFPEATVDHGQAVLEQSDVGIVALSDRFSDLFKMPSVIPSYVVDSAVLLSTTIVEGIDAAVRRAPVDTDLKDDLLRDNAALASALRSTVRSPTMLAFDLTGAYRAFVNLNSPADLALSELDTLAAILDLAPAVGTPTASRSIEAQNQAALQDINRRTAVVEMARSATRVDLVSSADAASLRDQLDERLDAEIIAAGDGGDDAVFAELRELRAKTVLDLDSRGARLPALRTFRLPATLPALVVASRLYDDPLRDSEIVARNGIRAPGFIRSQLDLEVLAE